MKRYLLPILSLPLLSATGCTDDGSYDAPITVMPQVEETPSTADAVGSFVGKWHRFVKDEPQGLRDTLTVWADTVWQGDRAYQQLALWGVDPTKLQVSDLVADDESGGTIPASALKMRSVAYVLGDAVPVADHQPLPRTTAYVADALVPLGHAAAQSEDYAKVWLTADIPADAKPGVYQGSIAVNGSEKPSFLIRLTVAPHLLPAPAQWKFHLDIWQFPFQLPSLCGVEPFSKQHYDMIRPFYQLLADGGQKAVTTYIKDGAFALGQTMVDWRRAADGSWQWDYTHFDQWVEFMFSLGIDSQIDCLSPAGWCDKIGYTDLATGEYRYLDTPIGSGLYRQAWVPFLADFRQHLQQKGWMERALLMLDEVPQGQLRTIISIIQDDCPDWHIGLAGRAFTPDLERQLYDYSTIINYHRTSTNNSLSTFYTSCSQARPNNYLTPLTSTAEMSWMAWHAIAGGYNGYLRWAYDYWTLSEPLSAIDGLNTAGDFSMIYRSDNTPQAQPWSSIRWEMLRDGIQDFEKARILRSTAVTQAARMCLDDDAPQALQAVKHCQSVLKQQSMKH